MWLIFDIGNVVVRLASPYQHQFLDCLDATERSRVEGLLADCFTVDKQDFTLTEKFELGRTSTSEYCQAIVAASNGKVTAQQIIDDKNRLLVAEIPETVQLLQQLKHKHHHLACLSNTHPIHWEELHRRFSAMKHFERQFNSFTLGVAKPNPECFRAVCNALGAQQSECILIDDLEKNVRGARDFGMKSILFNEPGALRVQLRELGVKIEREIGLHL